MTAQASRITRPIETLHGGKLVLASIIIGLASFMAVVDITIANVSIPTISGNVGVSSEEGEWIITLFAIANAIFIPLTGWLSQRFGQVRLFVVAVTLFTLASVLCGLAWSFESLLVFRILQGAVSGPIVPLSQALLVAIFPAQKRSSAVAMWAMVNMAGPVAGPMLGGWITDQYSWPWIFLVNAPVGLFVVGFTLTLLRGQDTPTRQRPVDVVGLILLAVAMSTLQITLDRGRILDWFSSPAIIACTVAAVLALIGLVVWELDDEHPVIDLRLFAHRNFAAGTAAVSIGFGVYFGAIVLLPLWLQTNMDYSATWAGLATAPLGLFGIVLAPLMGKWVAKYDPRLLASVAFVTWALVAYWRSTMATNVDIETVALGCLMQGLGIAFFLSPLVSLSLAGLPQEKLAAASGVQTAIRMMSGALFSSIAQTLWDRRARVHQNHLVDGLSALHPDTAQLVDTLRATGLSMQQVWGVIDRQLAIQSNMLSLNDFFYLSMILFAMALGLVWLARSPHAARR
jgi:MFS transporter, DHA2 family, multidrug resistance protein